MVLAGSALKQGCTNVSDLLPNRGCAWLLLSGATDPPSGVSISERRSRDAGDREGSFLHGVTRDLVNMEDAVKSNLYNTVKDLYLSKSGALGHIEGLFKYCKVRGIVPMLYYTGHGEIGTGNWCFADGTISITEVSNALPGGAFFPTIVSDACYSGNWANHCAHNKGTMSCLAACPEHCVAYDIPDRGGELTSFITGNGNEPQNEPLYSRGDRSTYGIRDHPVLWVNYISSHCKNTEEKLIHQSFCNGKLSAIFGSHKQMQGATAWWRVREEDAFVDYLKENWNSSKNLYSLKYDEEKGFASYFLSGYGSSQTLVRSLEGVAKAWNDGKRITCCTSVGSSYYCVMTKGVFDGKKNSVI